MKCKNCFNLEKMKDYAKGDVYDWCVVKHDNPDTDMERDCPLYKPRTNYDRIVSKTPEELAEWIVSIEPAACPWRDDNGDNCRLTHCHDCWLDWLKQEVTDGI